MQPSHGKQYLFNAITGINILKYLFRNNKENYVYLLLLVIGINMRYTIYNFTTPSINSWVAPLITRIILLAIFIIYFKIILTNLIGKKYFLSESP